MNLLTHPPYTHELIKNFCPSVLSSKPSLLTLHGISIVCYANQFILAVSEYCLSKELDAVAAYV